jgi:LPS-assembly lipoprotein
MSWSRTMVSRRDLLGLAGRAVALMPLAALAGCGFKPLYGQTGGATTDVSVSDSLASVRVTPMRDRVGQQMHNFLRDRLNPYGQPAAPLYKLQVELRESVDEVGVRRDETATRANLKLTANFVLQAVADGAELTSGSSVSTTSFDILDEAFATTVSEEDARERALREVADDIRRRLAVYFARV